MNLLKLAVGGAVLAVTAWVALRLLKRGRPRPPRHRTFSPRGERVDGEVPWGAQE